MIPVYKPYLNADVLKYAYDALASTWISSKGKYVIELETDLTKLHAVDDARTNTALTCCNGTAATHLIAKTLKQFHPNIKKIIAPNNVYVAAWNAFLFDGCFEIEIVETDPDTWNVDIAKLYEVLKQSNLEETALLVVHNIGNIVNVPQIQRDWPDLVIVEDNCEGFMGKYEGHNSGTLSFASSISFFGNKTVTSGEGGAIISDTKCQRFLYKMRSQGQSDTKFIHDVLGYNYRMTNVQAALLKGQLEHIDEIIFKKNKVFDLYRELLLPVEEVSFQKSDINTKHSNWMFGIKIVNGNYSDIESFLNKNFIDVRPMFYPIHRHKHLQGHIVHGGNDVAKTLNKECVILPSYPDLQEHEICHIVNCIKQCIANGFAV